MGFRSVEDYNNSRYGGMFLLQNDGDYADIVFLYRNKRDVLVADTHYIKSSDYTGYVHCCGRGCPACAKGIRVQPKLFVPMYVIREDKILFFDRNIRFDAQLSNDVFSRYPNPSEYVFRITRHGASGDVNTRYEIMAVGRNTVMPYDQILAKFNATMPDYYSTVCRDIPAAELNFMLHANAVPGSTTGVSNMDMPDYQVSPRRAVSADAAIQPPSLDFVDTPDVAGSVDDIPAYSDPTSSDDVDMTVDF